MSATKPTKPKLATIAETAIDLAKNLKLARDIIGKDKLAELLDNPAVKAAGEALLGSLGLALGAVSSWAGGILIVLAAVLKARKQLGTDASKAKAAAIAESEARKIAQIFEDSKSEQLNARYLSWVIDGEADENTLDQIDDAELSPLIQLYRAIRQGNEEVIQQLNLLVILLENRFDSIDDRLERIFSLILAIQTRPEQSNPPSTTTLRPSLNVPSLGDLFIEREAEMAEVAKYLVWDDPEAARGQPVKVRAYHGEPGSGKTQFAAEFAYRLHQPFSEVLFVRLPDLSHSRQGRTLGSAP